MKHTQLKLQAHRFRSRTEQFEYGVIFIAAFALFFVTTCLSRLVPRGTLASINSAAEQRPSILKEAWSAAGTATSYAFMG